MRLAQHMKVLQISSFTSQTFLFCGTDHFQYRSWCGILEVIALQNRKSLVCKASQIRCLPDV